jgi:hypothetical protein
MRLQDMNKLREWVAQSEVLLLQGSMPKTNAIEKLLKQLVGDLEGRATSLKRGVNERGALEAVSGSAKKGLRGEVGVRE